MPRDLAEVLHYFLPDAEGRASVPPGPDPASHPVLAVPLPRGDLVRSALFWNLAVAAARLAGGVRVVTLPAPEDPPVAPEPGRGPLGIEVLHAEAAEPSALAACARAAARSEGLVIAAVPPEWLRKAADLAPLLSWVVTLARPEPHEMLESYAALKRAALQHPEARLGACVFGVRRVAQAQRTFERLALTVERHLDRELVSYGMLIDDVQLSRSVVSRRPIALSYPAAPAARALTDVAGMLLEDA